MSVTHGKARPPRSSRPCVNMALSKAGCSAAYACLLLPCTLQAVSAAHKAAQGCITCMQAAALAEAGSCLVPPASQADEGSMGGVTAASCGAGRCMGVFSKLSSEPLVGS